MMDPTLPVLARDEALARLEGDVDLWNEIRDIWLEDVSSLFDGVGNALGQRSPDGIRRAAHALKGASANVGAVRVAAVAKRIEIAAPAEDWKDLTDLVKALAAEIEEARRRMGPG